MPVTARSDQDLDPSTESGTGCEEEAGIAGQDGRLPLDFYHIISRHAASDT